MRKSIRGTHALLAAMLLCGVAEAQEVNYDFDRRADFRSIKSYAFKEGGEMSDNPFVNERIANAIAFQLQVRGVKRGDNPDVYITTSLNTEMRKEVTAWNAGFGYNGWYGPYSGWHYGYAPYGWGGWWGPTSYEVRDRRYDTLTINIIDAKTGKLLWRGTGTREIDPDWKPSKLTEKVNKTVAKIFKYYPYYPAGLDEDSQ
jgi:hypothetical protein